MDEVRRGRAEAGEEPHTSGWPVAVACALLLVAFGVTAWAAVRTKCATYDEPLHSTAAYVISQYDDYRVNFEDPPLWQRYISLALRPGDLKVDIAHPLFQNTLETEESRWFWVLDFLYYKPGNNTDALLMKARTMLIFLGIALGAIIALWSWRLGGGAAAIAATVLFALDPNFLAHTALVKNDVAISLVGASLAYATWRAGRRLTFAAALAVVLLGSAAMVTKFSGPLLLIALALSIAVRVLLPGNWRWGNHREAKTFVGKAALGGGLLLLTGIVAFVGIWANYSFRYAPDRAGHLWDFQADLIDAHVQEVRASHPDNRTVTEQEFKVRQEHPTLTVRHLTYIHDHHLLPETWSYGMIYVYAHSRLRPSYLCGQTSELGFLAYFPLAFLFKTPLATLIALAASVLFGVRAVFAAGAIRGRFAVDWKRQPVVWSIACIAVPVLVLGFAALSVRLNIGVRHILPLYPFFYIAAGCAAAGMWRRWGRNGRLLLGGLAVVLLLETASAFPDYIAFFNRAAGGERGGLRLLGDSNLDWGQDLPLLARWQKQHPDRTLYLVYFGTADADYYGIQYTGLPGNNRHQPDRKALTKMPTSPGVIAISATHLQGIYLPENWKRVYSVLRDQTPLDVLGGSIYLYEYNP